jgi:hypothetical protein
MSTRTNDNYNQPACTAQQEKLHNNQLAITHIIPQKASEQQNKVNQNKKNI